MPTIRVETPVKAPAERCFDLARSIDFHLRSTRSTGERAVGGVTSGLIGLGETVTWRARHLGVVQELTVVIDALDRPTMFRDRQIRGAFRAMVHEHRFEPMPYGCLMVDLLEFESPFGGIGRLFNRLILTRYMTRFLANRGEVIRRAAEGEEWKEYLDQTRPSP